jgi:hypothetical protein
MESLTEDPRSWPVGSMPRSPLNRERGRGARCHRGRLGAAGPATSRTRLTGNRYPEDPKGFGKPLGSACCVGLLGPGQAEAPTRPAPHAVLLLALQRWNALVRSPASTIEPTEHKRTAGVLGSRAALVPHGERCYNGPRRTGVPHLLPARGRGQRDRIPFGARRQSSESPVDPPGAPSLEGLFFSGHRLVLKGHGTG